MMTPTRAPGAVLTGLLLLGSLLGCQKQEPTLRDHVTLSGTVEASERWSGQVKLTGDVVIPEGVLVSVKPGANVNFVDSSDHDVRVATRSDSTEVLTHDGLVDVVVWGNLRIPASSDAMVYVGTAGEGDFRWGSILFMGPNERSVIRHTEIKHGKGAVVFAGDSKARLEASLVSFGGINVRTFDVARPTLVDNRLENAFAAVYSYHRSEPAVRGNRLTTLTHGVGATDQSQPYVANNTITSAQTAIICMDAARPRIEGNTIRDNDYGLVVRDQARPALRENVIENSGKQDVVGLDGE